MRRTGLVTATALLSLLTMVACSGGDDKKPSKTAAIPEPPVSSGKLVKEAWSGIGAVHSRLEMKQVERHKGRSVLRYFVESLEKDSSSTPQFVTCAACNYDVEFYLVDPVNGKAYYPLTDGEGNRYIGSAAATVQPGAKYEAVLHFPPIPDNVRVLTVVTPSTAGEFTSVPVTGAKGPWTPAAPNPPETGTPPPGSTFAWPVYWGKGVGAPQVRDLYGITEGEAKSSVTTGTDETISLSEKVLFAYNKAILTTQAKTVLDDVANETRAKADPAKPPIIIEGHTDSHGEAFFNQKLSQRRAEAVRKELESRLGSGYQYMDAGRGEKEPVAKEGGANDKKARQRNRRVEVSFKIKQHTPGATTSPSPSAKERAGITTPGQPARFRPDDGKTVATRTAVLTGIGAGKRRLDVKAMYRDGAYLVVPFEITNLGPGTVNPIVDYGDLDYAGHNFSAFKVIDPASKTVYRGVRIGPQKLGDDSNLNFVDPGWATFRTEKNTSNRGFFYVPGPPANVTSITLDAGAFGIFPNVPIR